MVCVGTASIQHAQKDLILYSTVAEDMIKEFAVSLPNNDCLLNQRLTLCHHMAWIEGLGSTFTNDIKCKYAVL